MPQEFPIIDEQTLWEQLLFLLKTNVLTIVLVLLGLLIISRMIRERRQPGNVLAWAMLIIFFPPLGVPLYALFGGRKSRYLVRMKRQVTELASGVAASAAKTETLPPHPKRHLPVRIPGNRVTLLAGRGVETFDALMSEIEGAEKSINLMTYILGKDAPARKTVDALARRARDGVKVRLLLDAYGSFLSSRGFCDPIREAGGEVARFMPMLPLSTHFSANLRNHRKIFIFDHERAIVGGQNIDNRFLGEQEDPCRFKDFSAHVHGPAVAALTHIFVSDWAFAARQSPEAFIQEFSHQPQHAGESEIEVIASGPDCMDDPLWERMVTYVQECRQTLTIITPYFLPDRVLFASLLVKARAGKHIRIIIPEKSNHPIVDVARDHFLRELHEAGVEILFYQKGVIHAKLMMADDEVALIGSANIDPRSLFTNFEIGLAMNKPADIATFSDWIKQTLPDCLSYEQTGRAEGRKARLLIEDFAHLFVPML